jgi:hypothetical protein
MSLDGITLWKLFEETCRNPGAKYLPPVDPVLVLDDKNRRLLYIVQFIQDHFCTGKRKSVELANLSEMITGDKITHINEIHKSAPGKAARPADCNRIAELLKAVQPESSPQLQPPQPDKQLLDLPPFHEATNGDVVRECTCVVVHYVREFIIEALRGDKIGGVMMNDYNPDTGVKTQIEVKKEHFNKHYRSHDGRVLFKHILENYPAYVDVLEGTTTEQIVRRDEFGKAIARCIEYLGTFAHYQKPSCSPTIVTTELHSVCVRHIESLRTIAKVLKMHKSVDVFLAANQDRIRENSSNAAVSLYSDFAEFTRDKILAWMNTLPLQKNNYRETLIEGVMGRHLMCIEKSSRLEKYGITNILDQDLIFNALKVYRS